MKPYYHTSSNEINDGSIGLIYVMYPIISYVYIYILSQPYDINVIYIYVFIEILDDVMYLIIYIYIYVTTHLITHHPIHYFPQNIKHPLNETMV